jgi:hypothetical protein
LTTKASSNRERAAEFALNVIRHHADFVHGAFKLIARDIEFLRPVARLVIMMQVDALADIRDQRSGNFEVSTPVRPRSSPSLLTNWAGDAVGECRSRARARN